MLSCCRSALAVSSSSHGCAVSTWLPRVGYEWRSSSPDLNRHTTCRAVNATDVDVSDEWVTLLDPGQGTTRSQGRSKRPALRAKKEHLHSIAVTLAGLTTAQLSVVQHLLSDRVVDATLRARAINRTNQGRSREEKLISKLLMSEHTDPELAQIEAAVTAILTPGGSKQGTSPAVALAESWCSRLLTTCSAAPSAGHSTAPSSVSPTAASSAASGSPVGPRTAGDAEQDVIDAAIAAGEDISHFRALLRRARNKAKAAASSADSSTSPMSALGSARAAAERQILEEAQNTPGADTETVGVSQGTAQRRRNPRSAAQWRAASSARAALLKWLRVVAEAAAVAAAA